MIQNTVSDLLIIYQYILKISSLKLNKMKLYSNSFSIYSSSSSWLQI